MRVHDQLDVAPGLTQLVIRRERYGDLITDAGDIHHRRPGMFFHERSGKSGDHAANPPSGVRNSARWTACLDFRLQPQGLGLPRVDSERLAESLEGFLVPSVDVQRV